MTVYVTADELLDIEHARLMLRREHGLAVDRGRLVREALALVLADLEATGRRQRPGPAAARRVSAADTPARTLAPGAPRAGQRGAGVRRTPGQLRGPLRPAARPDRQAQARHHRGRALAGHRRVHRPRQEAGRRVGPRADDVVPGRRRHPARPQGRPAAAAGRRGGRGGPRAARGARPAVRPPHAVPRLQAGRLGARGAAGLGVAPAPARGGAGGAVRRRCCPRC